MGHTPAVRPFCPSLRLLAIAAMLAAFAAQVSASQGPGYAPPQLDLSTALGASSTSASAPAAGTLNDLAVVLRTGASSITAQAARMQSGVVNATTSLLRGFVAGQGDGAGGRQGRYDEYGIPLPASRSPGVTLDDAQRCAACSPDSQPVCCRRRATYVNACKAAACFGEVPGSCTAGDCQPAAGTSMSQVQAQADGLISVLGLPAPAGTSGSGPGPAKGGIVGVGDAVQAYGTPPGGVESGGAFRAAGPKQSGAAAASAAAALSEGSKLTLQPLPSPTAIAAVAPSTTRDAPEAAAAAPSGITAPVPAASMAAAEALGQAPAPAWAPESCNCPMEWQPICCGGQTYMNRCTAVCVGGVVDTGTCVPSAQCTAAPAEGADGAAQRAAAAPQATAAAAAAAVASAAAPAASVSLRAAAPAAAAALPFP